MDEAVCLKQIGDSINKAHQETSTVTVLLENMCKQVNNLGRGEWSLSRRTMRTARPFSNLI